MTGGGKSSCVNEVVVSIGLTAALTETVEELFVRALTKAEVLLAVTAGEEEGEEGEGDGVGGDLVKIRFAKAERRLLGRDSDDDRGGGVNGG